MTVLELIDLLEHCDPNAIVTDWDGDEIMSVNDLGETVELWA